MSVVETLFLCGHSVWSEVGWAEGKDKEPEYHIMTTSMEDCDECERKAGLHNDNAV